MSRKFQLIVCCALISIQLNAQVPPYLETQFQQIIENSLINPGVKGISACVILPGDAFWTGQAGDNGSGVAIVDTTVFYAGSTTKTFIATRLLQLWESGLLNLDTSYTAYIDTTDFVLPETTIRQMLNHTSGVYDVDQHPMFFIDQFSDPSHFYTPAEILHNYLNQPHIFAPGSDYEYSNSNYIILGTVIEAITGNPVEHELRNYVFSTLPLHHTYFGAYELFSEPYCGLWMFVDDQLTDLTDFPHTSLLSAAFSAGNIVSYPLDEAIFIRNLINGNILGTAAMSEMLNLNPFSNDYGLGIMALELGQDTMIYGHNGGIGNLTEMFHSPELDLTVVVMQNSENGDAQPFNYLFLSALEYLLTNIETNDESESSILFPNPAGDYISLSTTLSERKYFEIYSFSGMLVSRTTFSGDHSKVNISNLKPGNYLMIVKNDNGILLNQKFVKK
ncbi:MAG: serine hydrolase [Bacteroidota bacterium]